MFAHIPIIATAAVPAPPTKPPALRSRTSDLLIDFTDSPTPSSRPDGSRDESRAAPVAPPVTRKETPPRPSKSSSSVRVVSSQKPATSRHASGSGAGRLERVGDTRAGAVDAAVNPTIAMATAQTGNNYFAAAKQALSAALPAVSVVTANGPVAADSSTPAQSGAHRTSENIVSKQGEGQKNSLAPADQGQKKSSAPSQSEDEKRPSPALSEPKKSPVPPAARRTITSIPAAAATAAAHYAANRLPALPARLGGGDGSNDVASSSQKANQQASRTPRQPPPPSQAAEPTQSAPQPVIHTPQPRHRRTLTGSSVLSTRQVNVDGRTISPPGSRSGTPSGRPANPLPTAQQPTKKEELWRRRWARAESILEPLGIVLRTWRVGTDLLDESVQLVAKVREEGKQGGMQGGKQGGKPEGKQEGRQEGRQESRREGTQEIRQESRQEGRREDRPDVKQQAKQETLLRGQTNGTGSRA